MHSDDTGTCNYFSLSDNKPSVYYSVLMTDAAGWSETSSYCARLKCVMVLLFMIEATVSPETSGYLCQIKVCQIINLPL